MGAIKIAVAQINVRVGDIKGNVSKITRSIERAGEAGADLVCFPELAVTGYPPEDLLFKAEFIQENIEAVEHLAPATKGITALVGFAERDDDIFNSAALLSDGHLHGTYRKHFLPTYGVFDEDRYFAPGTEALVFELHGVRVGVTICEDLWYAVGPGRAEALGGNAQILVNLSSSPFQVGKREFKERMFATRAADMHVFLVVANLVGGQDELVFDGQSVVFGPRGEVMARARAFEEDMLICTVNVDALLRARLADPRRRKEKILHMEEKMPVREIALHMERAESLYPSGAEKPPICTPPEGEEEVLEALILGTRDYVRKNGFGRVVIGLSGGIDSSLTAAIAVMALGKHAVVGVSMPSRFTSQESRRGARDVAQRLQIEFMEIPIEEIHHTYLRSLAEVFKGLPPDVTEENIQARIRGDILMALSNKFGWLVLTTGNKSETSVGYCTLYGDTAGGYAVLKDVPKTMVYRLARYINKRQGREVIPEYIIKRPPTAELREGQLDIQSLPPYEVLDPIIEAYVERELSAEEIASGGFDIQVVRSVIEMIDRNEYKRRQSPPGIKITPREFGKERRFPITNAFASRKEGLEDPTGGRRTGRKKSQDHDEGSQ